MMKIENNPTDCSFFLLEQQPSLEAEQKTESIFKKNKRKESTLKKNTEQKEYRLSNKKLRSSPNTPDITISSPLPKTAITQDTPSIHPLSSIRLIKSRHKRKKEENPNSAKKQRSSLNIPDIIITSPPPETATTQDTLSLRLTKPLHKRTEKTANFNPNKKQRSLSFSENVHPNNLRSCEFDKETVGIAVSETSDIAREQDASKDRKLAAFSSCLDTNSADDEVDDQSIYVIALGDDDTTESFSDDDEGIEGVDRTFDHFIDQFDQLNLNDKKSGF